MPSNDVRFVVRAGFGLASLSVLLLSSCQRKEPPHFAVSTELESLVSSAEGDEDRQLWQELRTQIVDVLAKQCGTPLKPIVLGDVEADRARLEAGAKIYAYRCQQCHGTTGDGKGVVAQYLDPKPRDYTKGIFKFTSTPYGAKPMRSDLLRTLRRGVTGTSMPAFDDLSPEELEAVVEYVIFLSQRGELEQALVALAQDESEVNPEFVPELVDTVKARWTESQSQLVLPATPMPPMSTESVAKGHALYLQQACNKCHGIDGRGGLTGNIEVGKDAWGNVAAAADLTSGMYRGGSRPLDIYRRIASGINGTPMPSFAQAYASEPDNIWHLVHFIRDLGERRRRNQPPGAASPGHAPAAAVPATATPAASGETTPTTTDAAPAGTDGSAPIAADQAAAATETLEPTATGAAPASTTDEAPPANSDEPAPDATDEVSAATEESASSAADEAAPVAGGEPAPAEGTRE